MFAEASSSRRDAGALIAAPHAQALRHARAMIAARRIEPGLPSVGHAGDLSFREELHAYEALIAGQGIAIYSDLLAARALEFAERHDQHLYFMPIRVDIVGWLGDLLA